MVELGLGVQNEKNKRHSIFEIMDRHKKNFIGISILNVRYFISITFGGGGWRTGWVSLVILVSRRDKVLITWSHRIMLGSVLVTKVLCRTPVPRC